MGNKMKHDFFVAVKSLFVTITIAIDIAIGLSVAYCIFLVVYNLTKKWGPK